MARLLRALTLMALLRLWSHTAASKVRVTPVEKVVELLSDLKAEVESDGREEATTYNEFACFCKSKTNTLSDSILRGQDSIDSLAAAIQLADSTLIEKGEELSKQKSKESELSTEVESATAECEKELAEYEAADADVSAALSSLTQALEVIQSSAPSAPGASGAFSQVRTNAGLVAVAQKTAVDKAVKAVERTVQRNPKFADAMAILEQGPHWGSFVSLLQENAGVDPSDPDYKFHSQGIVQVITQLKATYTKRKEKADAEEGERREACTDKLAALGNDLEVTKQSIETLKAESSEQATTKATSRNELAEAEATLKDDQLYLKDLTEMCETRAVEYDQRAKQRGGELTAISSALAVLGEGVQPADEAANKRALLQSARPSLSLLQERRVRVREHISGSSHNAAAQSDGAATGTQVSERRARALELLSREAGRLSSTVLSVLATRASSKGTGPFTKLEKLIQDLIERLIQEATSEATKKGFCDTELAKKKTDRAFRMEQVNKLNAELMGLETKKDELEIEIEELTSALESLTADLATATELRAKEKADNLDTIKTAKDGLSAVEQAIEILNSFYSEAAKAVSFVQLDRRQKRYSPTEDDTSGAGFEGNYGGKQEAMKGIIGTLEVIKSDFDRTVRKTTEAEGSAAKEFVEFDRAANGDIAAKTTKKELDTEDLSTTETTIESKTKEMKTQMSLVDKALQVLEELKPMCVDSGMSYEERVAKREEEVEALKKALCMLDEGKVEAECASR